MHLPPRKHLAWPLRAGLSAGLASLMSLARSTIFVDAASANVLSAAVFGTVVAIVCSGPTRGSTLATSWGITGGAIMGCILSALCAALFGSSLGAVLFSNSLVGVLVLYPRRFPVLAQKFAFGGSTVMLWGVYESLDLRWSTLGIPICTAYGAACAIFATLLFPCGASDVAREASEAAVASLVAALDDAVAAYASVDPSEREMRRARADTFRRDAERHLAALHAHAADARWERRAIAFGARILESSNRRAATETTEPEAAARALASAALHVRGMSLALDALADTDVARWHLLDPPSPGAHPARVFEGGSARVDDVLVAVGDAMLAATRARNVKEEDVVGAEARARLAEASARLDAILTEERRRHYAPNAKYSDAAETVARRALQANHLFVFSFQSLAGAMVKHLAREGAPGEGSEEDVCETCETPSSERASGAGGANAFGEAKTSDTKTSGAARFAADGSDTIGALLRCAFRADPRQVTYALKLSSACAAAGVLGWAVSGNGSWAALTVAMVGTREGEAVGGSFNAALLRMQGTVIGAMFSFALVVLLSGDLASGAGAGRLILLAGFAFLTTYLRLNAEYAYAGIVAAFTAYVVALGIPDDADVQTARSYAHKRIEQNLLGLVVLIVVEVFLFPTFAHDAARVAAANTVESARVAAETVYDATVGTDCARCRERAADDAQGALDAVESKLGAQKTLLVQAAAEPHLWSPAFPLAAHQTLATDLENVRRILGLMREALRAMATSESERQKKRGGAVGGEDSPTLTSTSFSRNGDGDADPRAQVAALLTPTDGYVTNLRRAVRARLAAAAEDLDSGEARWETRAASASIAEAQAALERAFVLHTLEIRERYRAGDASMFLPNHLMVPWHAYMLCTHVLANTVESLGAASWNALLAVKPPAKEEEKEEDSNGEDDLRGVRVEGDGRTGGNGGGSAAETKATDTADTARSTRPTPPPNSFGAGDSAATTTTREPPLGSGNGGALDFNGASDPGCRSDA